MLRVDARSPTLDRKRLMRINLHISIGNYLSKLRGVLIVCIADYALIDNILHDKMTRRRKKRGAIRLTSISVSVCLSNG